MKRSDLRTGDIIERRNGILEMIVGNVNGLCACMSSDKGFNDYYGIENDLKYADYEWGIVRVRRPNRSSQFAINNWITAPIIWERKVTKIVTMKQICEAFDCDEVEIVGAKEVDQNVHG